MGTRIDVRSEARLAELLSGIRTAESRGFEEARARGERRQARAYLRRLQTGFAMLSDEFGA